MNAHFLRGYMERHGDTMDTLAIALKIHPHTLYMKMSGGRGQQFNQGELKTIAERYALTPQEVFDVFFS